MPSERFIGLVRVSTEDQKESELGLLAGRADLAQYCHAVQGELIQVLQEVETGTRDEVALRPVLLQALALCKRHRATLLVPKVDRLTRSTCAHTDLKRSGVPFRACDNPHANEFTLDILVAVAAQEARAISDRTRKALLAYRVNGRISKHRMGILNERYPDGIPQPELDRYAGKLGFALTGRTLSPKERAKGNAASAASRTRAAIEVYADLLPMVREWQQEGRTLSQIADLLNSQGHTTRTGVAWGPVQVHRMLKRSPA